MLVLVSTTTFDFSGFKMLLSTPFFIVLFDGFQLHIPHIFAHLFRRAPAKAKSTSKSPICSSIGFPATPSGVRLSAVNRNIDFLLYFPISTKELLVLLNWSAGPRSPLR